MQVEIIYSYVDMDTTMLDLITKASGTVRERMIAEFNQLPIGLLDLHKSRFTTFDLENGEIEFDLYLPIPMENFEKMMRFTLEKYKKKLYKMADKYFPRHDFVLSDFYYSFPPVQWSMMRDWVPPFDGKLISLLDYKFSDRSKSVCSQTPTILNSHLYIQGLRGYPEGNSHSGNSIYSIIPCREV